MLVSFVKPSICLAYVALITLMSSCASHVPPEIRQFPDTAPTVGQVHKNAELYVSQKVRWGGIILQTENRQKTSWLTIIAMPLGDDGKPLESDASPGRFIAIVDDFLEPEVYSQNRHITLTGELLRTESREVGEFPYDYPVIQVDHYYLWPVEQEPVYIDNPPYWWYDPWYYPYYPWHHPYYPYRYY